MKKLLLIIFGAFLLSSANAQVLFEETFSAGAIPVPGWLIMGNSANFANPVSNIAGGTAPELVFDNDPVFPNTTMRIISPQINTTGSTQLIIRFKHMFEHVSGNTTAVTLKLETRSGTSGTWNTVWTASPTANIDAQGLNVLVNNANVGTANFQLSFVITGSSQIMKNWFIDDVIVLKPLALDGAISSVNLPSLFTGIQPIEGEFSNLGTTAVNSIDVNWKVDDGDVHTTSYTGLNVPLGGSAPYISADSMDLPEGNYDLYVWVSNVNGVSLDDDPLNDTLVRELSIPDRIIYYIPFFEEFTSSTCGPCATFNNGVFNPFLAQHDDDDLTLIKYQMNWPGSGDPYYTAEGGTRRTYYGVNAVPDLYVDGNKVATSASGVNGAYNATSGTMGTVFIESTHEIQGNNVIIDANVTPYANYSNVKIHISVIEKMTTQNVATNGETQFHHVMMKMVPNANGTSAELVNGQTISLKHTVNMTSTNVEEMDDLMVAIFIQEASKNILQSGYSLEVGATISSSIPDEAINVPVDQPIIISFSQPVRMIGGQAITNANVASVISFKEGDASGAAVGFVATINDAKTQITITPQPNLKYLQRYYLNVLPVENYSSTPTVSYVTNFTTKLNVGVIENPVVEFSVYPNPANSMLTISNVSNIRTVEIYSIVGNLIRSIELNNNVGQHTINVSNMPAGVYIMKAKGVQTEKAVRFIISR